MNRSTSRRTGGRSSVVMRADHDPLRRRLRLAEVAEVVDDRVEVGRLEFQVLDPGEPEEVLEDGLQALRLAADPVDLLRMRRSRGVSGSWKSSASRSRFRHIVESGLRISWARPPASWAISAYCSRRRTIVVGHFGASDLRVRGLGGSDGEVGHGRGLCRYGVAGSSRSGSGAAGSVPRGPRWVLHPRSLSRGPARGDRPAPGSAGPVPMTSARSGSIARGTGTSVAAVAAAISARPAIAPGSRAVAGAAPRGRAAGAAVAAPGDDRRRGGSPRTDRARRARRGPPCATA